VSRTGRGSTGPGRRSALPSGTYQPLEPGTGGLAGLMVGFRGDDGRDALFDVSALPLPGWHEPLAAAFAARTGPAGRLRTRHSAVSSWAALGRLMRFLEQTLRPPATPQALTRAHLEGFYRHRAATVQEAYAVTDIREAGMILLLPPLKEQMDPAVLGFVRQRSQAGRARQGVPGYSDGEFARLTAAARADVAAIRDRIQAGESLLARYQSDPASLSPAETSLGAQLAEMAATGVVPEPAGPFRSLMRQRTELAGHLFVTMRDLAPLLVLMVAVTGRNGETIKELPARHRIIEDRAVELLAVKRRRGPRRWFDTVTWEIGPKHRELHTPGGLYLLLLRLTARSRAFSGAGHALCAWRNGYQSHVRLQPAEHHAPYARALNHASIRLSDWAASRAQPVLADPPGSAGEETRGPGPAGPLTVSLNRVKTSVEVRRTRQMGGHLPSAARTNTIPVLFGSYLSGDPVIAEWAHEIIGAAAADAEQAALRAHQRLLARAGGAIRVVPGPASAAAEHAGADGPAAARQLDTAWAACTDHDHHPVTGKRCGWSFLDCFHCGNCLVTRDHLPALLGLLDALEARRQQVSEQDWWNRYGAAWAAIRHDILAKFSPEERDQAARDKPADTLLDLVENPWQRP
jgi:hypothetical protein